MPHLSAKDLQPILDLMNKDLLSIREAAEWLGVSNGTLRNWDKRKKLVAYRHPLNNYRVYKRDDLEKIVKQIESGERPVKQDANKPRKLSVIHVGE